MGLLETSGYQRDLCPRQYHNLNIFRAGGCSWIAFHPKQAQTYAVQRRYIDSGSQVN